MTIDKQKANAHRGGERKADKALKSNGESSNGNGWASAKEAIIDATAYPLLTEQVNLPDSSPRGGGAGAPSAFGQVVTNAIKDTLGWQPRANDPKGFMGALTQSFALQDVEGHVEWTWTPRSYAVATDLSGGISGAQASLLTRAQVAIDACMPLLEGIYPLRVDADPQDSEALRSLVGSQLQELLNELAILGGPRVTRVDQIFTVLLGSRAGATLTGVAATSPDSKASLHDGVPAGPVKPGSVEVSELQLRLPTVDGVGGTVGALRTEFGLGGGDLVNTVDEERNQTNYRILADYIIGLERSWLENRTYFTRAGGAQFFGTQLVLLSRQFSVIAESVNEVRFALDSVFIGPLERQTLLVVPRTFSQGADTDFNQSAPKLELGAARDVAPGASGQVAVRDVKWWVQVHPQLLVEELLSWVETFANTEGPEIIRSGGKIGVQRVVFPTAKRLYVLTSGMLAPDNRSDLPAGLFTPRVSRAFQELATQIHQLVQLSMGIKHRTGGAE